MSMGLNRFHDMGRRDAEAAPKARAELDLLRAQVRGGLTLGRHPRGMTEVSPRQGPINVQPMLWHRPEPGEIGV